MAQRPKHICRPRSALSLRTLFVVVTVAACGLHSTTRGADPKESPQVCLSQGIACLEERDYDRAIEYFGDVVRLNPQNAEAYNFRAVAWKYKGEFDNMIRDCTEAIRIDPKFAAAYHNRGALAGQEGLRQGDRRFYAGNARRSALWRGL